MDAQTLRRIRADFPILSTRIDGQPLVYFDNAATTQKPRAVIDAITQYYRRDNANVHRAAHHLATRATDQFEGVRDQVAQFINASPNEIVWTRGTTEAINLVAESFLRPLIAPGDRIMIAISAHHACLLPFQRLVQDVGAHLDVVALDDNGDLDLSHFNELLKRRPRFVALPHVSNVLGTVYPIKTLVKAAKSAGAYTLIDGAQAAPHFSLDMNDINADFYAFSGHKLFGPTGIGVLFGRHALLDKMPPWQVGGEMIEHVTLEETRYAPAPLRFEAGTPDIAGVIGLGAAIRYLSTLDTDILTQHEQTLVNHLREGLTELPGITLLSAGTHSVSLVNFYHESINAADIVMHLDAQGIAARAGSHCAQPLLNALNLTATVRLSLAFYNTLQEVEHTLSALREMVYSNEEPNSASGISDMILALEHADNWPDRLNLLMTLGAVRTDSHPLRESRYLVPGCASQTWIKITQTAQQTHLEGDSESRQIKGLIHLIAAKVNQGHSIEWIRDYLTGLGLERQLSRSRGNAIAHLLDWLDAR